MRYAVAYYNELDGKLDLTIIAARDPISAIRFAMHKLSDCPHVHEWAEELTETVPPNKGAQNEEIERIKQAFCDCDSSIEIKLI